MPLSEYAGRLADGAPFDRGDARAVIERTLHATYLAEGTPAGRQDRQPRQ